MEKEMKLTETTKEMKKEQTPQVDDKTLYVVREPFKGNDDKDYWAYLLKGKVRNREIKVDFAPKDKGGYEPLDIVFDVSEKAELLIGTQEMTDANGKTTKYNTYTLRTIDEDGIPYQCDVKPTRDSDKALLFMLLNQIGKGGVV